MIRGSQEAAHMPVARAVDNPTFNVKGSTVTGLMAPSRGSTECVLYRIDVPSGLEALPPHRHDHEDLFTVASGTATVHIDGETYEVGPDDSVVVPTGSMHWIDSGPGGCVLIVTMLAGTLFIRDDAEPAVPPWGI
jgi:quercetin dioxygenase-like cupin family protein